MRIIFSIVFLFIVCQTFAQVQILEEKYSRIESVHIPDEIVLEVGGLAFNDKDQLGVTTRRGDLWVIDKPYSTLPSYNLYASGLHEPLGLAFKKGDFYSVQRGELTRFIDKDKDGEADVYETIAQWPLSGNYHEYSYGPLLLPNGDMIVTLNVGWDKKGVSLVEWRGWMMRISSDGILKPFASGLRSPAGMGLNKEGAIFYAENQGDWVGSGRITHVEEGDFLGHPQSLKWDPNSQSTFELLDDDFQSTIHESVEKIPNIKAPSVWFPHTIMGVSTSDILLINNNKFGPFEGQFLVGDQGQMKIMRVYLDKVNGQYQGACFPFREGFSSGILRMVWGSDHSLFVGMTSRGWNSPAKKDYGLERLVSNGVLPFEMNSIKLVNDGFEIEFTDDIHGTSAVNKENYEIANFTYYYHRKYGSPIIDKKNCQVLDVSIKNSKTVLLKVLGLREGFIHQINVENLISAKKEPLLHNTAYYSLNQFLTNSDYQLFSDAEMCANYEKDLDYCKNDLQKNPTIRPNHWKEIETQIRIGTKPGLKYNKEEFEVLAGSKVALTFDNNDDMLHNLIITKPNRADEIGELALKLGLDGASKGFVPQSDEVLYHTCVIQPNSSETIYFEAPEKGRYPYVCTFPGHHKVMRGTMIVK